MVTVLRKIRIGQLQGGAFAGGGLVEVYNDLHSGLVNLFRVIREPEQFAQQHRWLAFAIVPETASAITEIEIAPRTEQGFKHQVAVFIAFEWIARTPFLRHQIELGRVLPAWESIVLHAQYTNYRKRNVAHRLHAAEGDAS